MSWLWSRSSRRPGLGTLITFAQFVFVSVTCLLLRPSLLTDRAIPLSRWILAVALFFTVSLLNNMAFTYVSVPVHVLFRSGGTVVTMLTGWLFAGKRYTVRQVLAVVILSAGVVASTLSDTSSSSSKTHRTLLEVVLGVAILVTAQILSGLMGLHLEKTYQMHGSHWREGLFYTHFLALPLFIPFASQIRQQFADLSASPPLTFSFVPLLNHMEVTSYPAITSKLPTYTLPSGVFALFANILTQYLCVRGVNKLGASVSALTLTIVLSLRKFVSLALSVWLFGNEATAELVIGVVLVLGGAAWYTYESSKVAQVKKKAEKTE
ncbi:hypothetical protein G7K_6839-t2 [Saitoella complicata NRRL Y-17804]|uniref:Sugar phosphate transporter domain-containing protein n=1 Tax=Saitoella complicata (strain BCRC 22490 / CBS 7301 / JCM 7358 / NBRC 10748 / NRRL Y-17804) TaxID=698492 RepID=A0A0E9NS99_SAICN|nr:hypothetical protein G7K_6839-t2 [Saitoella complicata NRRL Y-17804]